MMKENICIGLIVALFVIQGCAPVAETVNNLTSPPSEVEQPLVSCTPSESRPTLAVVDFEIKAGHGASRELADGLSDMLVNALVDTQCFRVMERTKVQELLKEQQRGLGGTVDAATAAQVGKLIGAQLLVMGTVTEFKEEESGGLGGTVFGPLGARVGWSSAHVGFIIRMVDSSTGEIFTSKSIDKKVSKAGVAAKTTIFGLSAEGTLFKSKAMQDAVEQALIETVAVIAEEKERFAALPPIVLQPTPPTDCPQLATSTGPRFMVIIPEIHISRRVPDPAGETEIIRKFLEMGFNVVDPQQIAAIRYQERVLNAVNNPQAAAALGVEFGADVVVIGEAFSEFAQREGNLISCRARVEAKAIQTSTGRILATNGTHASGADIAELVAGKAALKNAGAELAEYFITQLCQLSFDQPQVSGVELAVTNINFRQMQRLVSFLESLPAVHSIEKQLTGNTARIRLQYDGSTDQLATHMTENNSSGLLFEITGLAANKINITVTGEGTPQQDAPLNEKELIRQIQVFLTKLGYDPGEADGVIGQKTTAAIKQYQQDVNVPVDGKPSPLLLESLKSQGQ